MSVRTKNIEHLTFANQAEADTFFEERNEFGKTFQFIYRLDSEPENVYYIDEVVDEAILLNGGTGGTSALFPNGVKMVTESRDFQADDAGYLLRVQGGTEGEPVVVSMPETNPFEIGDHVGIFAQQGDNGENLNGFVNVFEEEPVYSFSNETVLLTIIDQDGMGNKYLLPVSTTQIDDGGVNKTMLRYLYDNQGGGGSPAGSDNQIQINQSGSFFADNKFQKSDTGFNVGLDHTTQSAVTFTGSGLDDLTVSGTFSGTVPTTYTVTVASTGTPDTFDWTDGTNSGTGVSMSTSPTLLSNGISITFGADTGHTLSDLWTWTYSNVNQNVLDFSNNDYNFKSTFGTDTFGYQISDNLLGAGISGSANTWTTTGGDLALTGILNTGGVKIGNTIQLSTGELSEFTITGTGADLSVADALGVETLLTIIPTEFSIVNDNATNQNGIAFNSGGNGLLQLGNLSGGNNTRITIDDVNEQITIGNIKAFDDDAAAGTAGLTAGMVYMTTGSGAAPLNAAGILMIKQ